MSPPGFPLTAPPPKLPGDLPPAWRIGDPRHVARTDIADVYRVTSRWGPAALKLFREGNARNEARAPAWLAEMAGPGVVRCFAHEPGRVLLQWLDGPALGDITRQGADRLADMELADLAGRLLSRKTTAQTDFPDLAAWTEGLWAFKPADWWQPEDVAALHAARKIARRLLDTAPTPCLLHGDLHHDNVIRTGWGCVAIDPKGIRGDPAFELANAFRNPKGFVGRLDPACQTGRLALFAQATGLERGRIAGWAMVKCLLSSAWAGEDTTLVRFNLDVYRTLRGAFADVAPLS
ncbi:Aminoglycoside/hydroxyurea antibiotic resistance kinase [Pseudoruegeria aquimaris]|uniref:Aminoglycoside/hydroxyurea antibiotic resistance kinase n=1 Tax=Pseudoruegeria aquimaris TaxID=393663 RepID=A0A1Y5S276_9RHOB|nr:aminoglycoside phosphotransferase family protein [Pseudoruegeria aquimaris]SLN30998.1 Aminoglycoside/hydroxyurea antibiotic resistance kinase [Pseudoruegeria aquimaris]